MDSPTLHQNQERANLPRIIEDNAIASCRAWNAWNELELHDTSGLLYTMSHHPFPIFNAVLQTCITEEQAEERIESLMEQARRRGVGLIWFVAPGTRPPNLRTYLEAKGFFLGGTATGMSANLHRLNEEQSLAADLVIEEVTDPQTFRTWSDLCCQINEFPEIVYDPWYAMHLAVGMGPDHSFRHYLASSNGHPVATSSLYLGPQAASVFSVGVHAEVRRQGIGTAITLAPLREARLLGYHLSTLCSSEMGANLYHNLGFQDHIKMHMYLWNGE